MLACVFAQGILMLTASSMIPDAEEDADKANPLQVGLKKGSLPSV
jgi:hypothetical protein